MVGSVVWASLENYTGKRPQTGGGRAIVAMEQELMRLDIMGTAAAGPSI